MPSSPQYVRADNVVARVIAGETLIVPVRRGVADLASLFSFNSVGSTIWEALEKPRTADELASVVADNYDVSPEKARQDLELFLGDALAAGVVQTVPQESANP
jgi:Coenzyme PQQ synthesis protein D (PqqD)